MSGLFPLGLAAPHAAPALNTTVRWHYGAAVPACLQPGSMCVRASWDGDHRVGCGGLPVLSEGSLESPPGDRSWPLRPAPFWEGCDRAVVSSGL